MNTGILDTNTGIVYNDWRRSEMAQMNVAEAIRLIAVGEVPAIKSSDVQVGMRIIWNYGSEYEVVSVRDASRNFIEIIERCLYGAAPTGKEYTRRLKKSRLVAAFWPKDGQ